MQRLITVSNRLPVVLEQSADGQWRGERAAGGLVAAMDPVMRRHGGVWVGWSGISDIDRRQIEQAVAPLNHEQRYDLLPVSLTARQEEGFYQGFSNQIIWPLFHDQLNACNFDPVYWRCYREVNRKFAEVVAGMVMPDDLIWVHDYHLISLGRALRELGVDNRIGFFLHIPFPTPDIFRHLPWHQDMLAALLEFDFVGLQTPQDRSNFGRCAHQLLADSQVKQVQGGLNLRAPQASKTSLRVDALPIGIDYPAVVDIAEGRECRTMLQRHRRGWTARKLILGVDRLDYTKGLPEKLSAFANVLERYPQLRRKLSLVQHVVPSRQQVPDYVEQRQAIEQLVGEINGRFTESGWVPIHYMFRSMPRPELMAYYRLADIALVTPLRDGMNLVSKEYCAANVDNDGVLILSEFAGSAAQLGDDALVVNPHDIEGVADRIVQAYYMPGQQRQARMRRLRRIVRDNDVYAWVDRFLAAAGVAGDPASPAIGVNVNRYQT